ncbi:MAG: hypothetical protein QOD11_302 [Bradyrhizobium sp.]|nr:hypothetical protein [Bradyrhizobium sp.]
MQPALPHPEWARPGVPAGPHRECPACPSAAVAPTASASQLPAAGPQVVRLPAEQAALRSEPEVPGVPAAPRREAQRVSATQPQAAQAASGAAVPVARGAERDAAAEPRQVAGSGAAVLPPEEAVERDAAVAAQPQAVERDVAVLLPEEGAERDVAAAAQPQGAARVAAAGRPQAVAAELRPGAARPVAPGAEGLHREAPDVRAARPSAAAWAAPPCLQAARPAPSPQVRSAHARKDLRIAQP